MSISKAQDTSLQIDSSTKAKENLDGSIKPKLSDKRAKSSTIEHRLSLVDKRAQQKRCIMKIIKENEGHLIDFNDIMYRLTACFKT